VSDRRFYRWFYDNIGSRYYDLMIKWAFSPFGGEVKVRRELLDVVALEPGEKILDMCCGTGGTTFAIAEKVGDESAIVGIDLSHGQIRMAKRRDRSTAIEFAVMDASCTSFRDGAFQRIVIPHAIHEMQRPLRLMVLREARRILANNGTLAVLELDDPPGLLMRLLIGFMWFYWLPFNFETPTRRDMLKHTLLKEVEEAGFHDVSKSSFHKGVFQVVQCRK
jgi:demethylmenaquinone methyltransferase/2-methoxy-6-polyprenyl-1,4-benzoquinol methylase